MKSIAERSLDLASLFEAEVFVRLMLKSWNHPLADDAEFANDLLEIAANALRDATQGTTIIEGLPAESTNFIAAIWYAEEGSLVAETNQTILEARLAWLAGVRRAVPSCFCDPSDLQPE
jgi:hypothetical protein